MFKLINKLIDIIRNNKFIIISLILLLLIVFSVESGLIKEYITFEKPNIDNSYYQPYVEIKKDYEIYEISQPGRTFQYFIFDNEHKLLDYGYTNRIEPTVTFIRGLIKISIGLGTGYRICKYYDPEKRLISDWFENPINESKTMVVYVDIPVNKWRLVVQDIFDKSKYYRTFDRDFSAVQCPITQADFINNDKQLEIKYISGWSEHEVADTLDLYDTGGEP